MSKKQIEHKIHNLKVKIQKRVEELEANCYQNEDEKVNSKAWEIHAKNHPEKYGQPVEVSKPVKVSKKRK
jgi:hypothetical protein